MNEKKEITKQLIKNIFINFIIFIVILLVFDFIIYNQVVNSLYKDIDKQLENSLHMSRIIDEPPMQEGSQNQENKKPPERDNKSNRENKDISPRLIMIERNQNGEIQNEEELGSLSNYKNEIKFNSANLEKIYNLQIDNQYNYRVINFETTKNDETIYIQVLANVDGEAGTLENMKNTLILGTIVLVLISMIASYILSKRAMRPMIIAYEKQTEFVQNASHELRTPLTIIQAKQELLLTEPNKKIIEKSEDINLTLKETRRLSKLIKELMELARADKKKIKIEKQSTDINELIKEIVKPYVELAEIQNKKLKLELEYNKKIQINQNKINELFVILLDNSLKYTNEGDTITIKTYAKDGKCNIEVQDTGIGISKEGIKHIFERFYREDKARSRQTGGNGLGLAIAQNIITLHKGTIKAEHNDPKGTVIKIKI